jgi:pSer/pThr/pTyr-binding forkhead associated (FHA) protein
MIWLRHVRLGPRVLVRTKGMELRLVVVKGRPEGMEIPLPMPQFLIGRDPRCNLRPSSESVSKLHCAVVQRKEGVFVRDLKSTNGTFVNNDRIHGEVKVKDGDLIKVGPLVLAVKIQVAAGDPVRPSGNEEDQAVSWLLDFNAGSSSEQQELGTKTTIMDMSGVPKSSSSENQKAEAETKTDAPEKKTTEKPKSRGATAELASEILEKLLAPPRKKKS